MVSPSAETTILTREQCPSCKDSGADNLIKYSDGGEHCFACGYHTNGESAGSGSSSFKNGIGELHNCVARALPSRGISQRTCEHFSYGVGSFTGSLQGKRVTNELVHAAGYRDKYGELKAYKLRTKDKSFAWLGNTNDVSLFGQWLYTPHEKMFVTVCEGEIDALSIAEVQGIQYPVVSIPHGGAAGLKAIKQNLEWLSGFKHVVLCFDMDEAGRAATKACADLFEIGKVKVVSLPKKDANEMLTSGCGTQLRQALFNAPTYRPDTIVSVSDIKDKILKKPTRGLAWPWEKLNKHTYGIQPKQLITIGAGSGVGKTQFLTEVALDLAFKHEQNVGAIYLEQPPETTALKLIGGMLGKRLHVPGDQWDEKEIEECLKKIEDKIYFYDHFGGQNLEAIISKVRYMVKALDCKYIILDHLTALAAEMKEERKGIDLAMSKLGGIVQELDCTIFLVSHLAKPPMDGAGYEEGRRVTASSFRGSQSIQYWSTFMIGLERNKLSEDKEERNTLTVRILKDRFAGEADGEFFDLTYDHTSGKLKDKVHVI